MNLCFGARGSDFESFQAHLKQLENLRLEQEQLHLQQQIREGRLAAEQQERSLQLQRDRQQQEEAERASSAAAASAAAASAAAASAAATAASHQQLLQQDWKSIPVADDTLPKPWVAREDRCEITYFLLFCLTVGFRCLHPPQARSALLLEHTDKCDAVAGTPEICFMSTNHVGIHTLLQRPPRPLPNIRESGGHAQAAAAAVQVAPVPPRTYSEAAASLPAQSSQYWFSIYHLGKQWHLARLSGSLTSLFFLQRKCLSRKGTRVLKVRCVQLALVSRAH